MYGENWSILKHNETHETRRLYMYVPCDKLGIKSAYILGFNKA